VGVPRGRRARKSQSLPADLGLALHLQALRIGPWERSGHGTALSRDPDTGLLAPSGTFFRGVRRSVPRSAGSGEPLSALPGGTDLLRQALTTLEHHLHAVARVGFELRDGKLALLSACPADRPGPRAATRLTVDLAAAGTIDRARAVASIQPQIVQELLHAQLRLAGDEPLLVRGLAASPGAATGRIALSSRRALELAAADVPAVLVTTETTPADMPGILAAEAVVTTTGGLASHAAVVARGAGKPAVCGAADLRVDVAAGTVGTAEGVLREGDVVSVDGRTGNVYATEVEIHTRSRRRSSTSCCPGPTSTGACGYAPTPTARARRRPPSAWAQRASACAGRSTSSSVSGYRSYGGSSSPGTRPPSTRLSGRS